MDYPHAFWLHTTLRYPPPFKPYYLLIVLPSCTIRVTRYDRLVIGRWQFLDFGSPDHSIKPPPSVTRYSVRY
jgi:hypothetical protein